MVRWAKSWQTPARRASTSSTGVLTVVAPGANSNSSWRRLQSSSSASTSGRPDANDCLAYSIAADRRGHRRRAEDELAGVEGLLARVRGAAGRVPAPSCRSPIDRQDRTPVAHVDDRGGRHRERVVGLEDGEVRGPVAEEVASLAVVLGERVDGERRHVGLLALGLARVQVGLAVAGRHRGVVVVLGAVHHAVGHALPPPPPAESSRPKLWREGDHPLRQLMGEVGGVEQLAESA